MREQLEAMPTEKLHDPVIIDEVQKIPALLDEVHWLIYGMVNILHDQPAGVLDPASLCASSCRTPIVILNA